MKNKLPCPECITMAICNAMMHRVETQLGMNGFEIRKQCKLMKNYLEEFHTTRESPTTWRTSLRPMYDYFKGDDKTTYYITDVMED